MTKDDILHLSTLARVALSEAEITQLQQEVGDIIEYVSVINSIALDAPTHSLTPRFNVMRADEVTNTSGELSEAILEQAPRRKDRYFEVKKILNTDD